MPKNTSSSTNLGQHCLMKSAEAAKKLSESSLKRNISSEQLEQNGGNDLVKKKLLEQPLQDFEETLRAAANLKTILKEESTEATTQLIMRILEKDDQKKPVSYPEEMEFIDADGEVVVPPEATNATKIQVPRRGNVVTELKPMGVDSSRYSSDIYSDLENGTCRVSQTNITCDELEQMRYMPPHSMLKQHETILGPESTGIFTSFSQVPVGCDLIQRNPITEERFREINRLLSNEPINRNAHNSFNTMPEKKEEPKPAVEGKQRKTKKKQSKGYEYTAQATSLSDKTLNEILAVLGEDVSVDNQKGKKKKQQQQRTEAKEQEKNNKKKDKKKNNMEAEKASAAAATAVTVSEKASATREEESSATPASVNSKRCSSGVGGQSEEGDDENYMSAEEHLGGSNSRLSTPPAEFVDARASREEGLHNVMLDPSNYRDDEDVEQLAKQLMKEEDEFITVGKNKKKNKQQANSEEKAAGASSASNSPQLSSGRRFSDGNGKATNSGGANGNRRPTAVAATLADYIETTKKDTHKNVKHKFKAGPTKKEEEQEFEPLEVISPIEINTSTPTPAFSYADAAKKSSGENTPQNELSPSPAPNQATTSACSVQMPPDSVECPSTADDITFGYDESMDEDKNKSVRVPKEAENGGEFVLKLGERTIRFAKGHADDKVKSSTKPHTTAMLNTLRDGWLLFQSGTPPLVYNPDRE